MNSGWLSFEPLISGSLLSVLLVVPLVLLLWLEWGRKLPFKVFRISCLLALFLGLAGLFFRPHYSSSTTSSQLLLLTKGYDVRIADSLNKQHKLQVLRMQDAAPYPGAKNISDERDVAEWGKSLSYVIGEGLPSYALDYFQPTFSYFPARNGGLKSLAIPPGTVANRPQILRGGVPVGADWRIKLKSPEGGVDSVDTDPKSGNFQLQFVPQLSGQFLYQLQIEDKASGLTQVDSLVFPLEVLPDRQLSIMILQQFPTFESRHLKNLLAEQGHSVAVRYQLSKDEFRNEFINTEAVEMRRLSASLLKETDVLIADEGSLKKLSSAEQQVLRDEIRNGMGLLVLINQPDPAKRAEFLQAFDFSKSDRDTTTVGTWLGKAKLSVAPLEIAKSERVYPVWEDLQDRVVAAYVFSGLGKTGTLLWSDSYKLSLQGEKRLYAALWIKLLDQLARREDGCCRMTITSPAPYFVDEPVHFRLLTADDAPDVFYQGEIVPLEENWRYENVWEGTIWPVSVGWDSLRVAGLQKATLFFVQHDGEWASLESEKRRLANQIASAGLSANTPFSQTEEKKLVSPLIFYLLFLAAAAGLWLAPKL